MPTKPNAPIFLAALLLAAGAAAATGRSYHYDSAGRLILAVYEDGSALRYTYTNGDNIWSVTRLQLSAAPSDLAVQRVSDSVATLSWTDQSDNETGFVVMRRPAGSSAWTTLPALPANTTQYTDGEVLPGVNYVYRIAAVSSVDGLLSAYSREAAAGGEGSVGFSVSAFRPEPGPGAEPAVFLLTFSGDSRFTYQLEASATLEPAAWQAHPWSGQPNVAPAQGAIPGQNGPITIYVQNSREPARYFRVRLMTQNH